MRRFRQRGKSLDAEPSQNFVGFMTLTDLGDSLEACGYIKLKMFFSDKKKQPYENRQPRNSMKTKCIKTNAMNVTCVELLRKELWKKEGVE